MTLDEFNDTFEGCRDQLIELGYKQIRTNNYELEFNTRAKKRLGRCSKLPNGSYKIALNSAYAKLNPDKAKETIMHELIHSIDGCMNHKDKWQRIAGQVNRKYGYTISRCTDAGNEYREQTYERTYKVKCSGCGRETSRERMSKLIQHPEKFRCGICGSSLERIQ